MSRLIDYFIALATETEEEAIKAEKEAAVAVAYGRKERDNEKIVDAAIKAITDNQKDASPVQTATFVAALSALPKETRLERINALRTATTANRKLEKMVGWSTLKARIKDASEKVDAARAGEANANGLADGTIVDALDPLGQAEVFVERHLIDGHCTIVRWKNRWYKWNGAIYIEIDDEAMTGMAYQFLSKLGAPTEDGPGPIITDKKIVEFMLHALAPLVLVQGSSAMQWRDADKQARPNIERCVFCTNGTLDIDAWMEGKPTAFIAPTPALFVIKTMAMPFDPAAKAPRFERFISEIFDASEDRIMAMRILFGYWLIASMSLQIIVVFSGMPQTGKGTLMTIIQKVLGISCSNPSFEQLGGHFGLEDLVGSNLAILSDVHDTGPNAKSAVEKLLKISGEDAVDIPRKHKPAINGINLTVRFILAMNELVSLPDISGALYRRLVVIPFLHSFLGKGVANLAKDIVADEGPGVLLWALEGLRLLQHVMHDAAEKGLPTKDAVLTLLRTKEGHEDMEMLADLGNPVRVFAREQCVIGSHLTVELNEIYDYWTAWAERNGHQVRSKSRFAADLFAATKGAVSNSQRSDPSGLRPRVLKGITLQDTLLSKHGGYQRSSPMPEAKAP
jgi:putative DNA primase/helicase